MKTAGKFQRVSAAVAALAMTFLIVWGISGYAYPDHLSSSSLGELASGSVIEASLAEIPG
jgi:hypothetical protein